MSLAAVAPPRAIVRDPLILGGRWCLEGTTVAIAEIRADYQSVPNRRPGSYHYPDVTPAELEAVLAYAFPVIRPTAVTFLYGAFVVGCECGEDTPAALSDLNCELVHCVCGRKWWIRIVLEADPSDVFLGVAAGRR